MTRGESSFWQLDGLRGIAILLVLARHAVQPFYDPNEPGLNLFGWDAMTPMVNGWAGVDLFFVLSGFLVTHHILRRWGESFDRSQFREYVGKRMLRIIPAYYCVVLLIVLGAFPFYRVAAEGLTSHVGMHLLFFQDYVPSRLMVSFWSLGVEEKFYLLAPLLVTLLGRLKTLRARVCWLVSLILVSPLLRWLTYMHDGGYSRYGDCFWAVRSPFHVAFDSLLVGTLCAYLFQYRDQLGWLVRARALLSFMGASLAALLLCAHPLLEQICWFDATLLMTTLGISFGLVVLGLILGPKRQDGILASASLFFFSRISYSLYLVHMAFVQVVYLTLSQFSWFDSLPRGAQFLVYLPVFSAVSIAAALLLHFLVEQPFCMLKDRYRVSARRTSLDPFGANALTRAAR